MKVGATALTIANSKVSLEWWQALVLGVFCNALVCLAVWLCYSARSAVDKIVAIVPPVTAFVASGFEHSIVNIYFVPLGMLLRDQPQVVEAATKAAGGIAQPREPDLANFIWNNLPPVTIGNIIGGAVLVGMIYWLVYLRGPGWLRLPAPTGPAGDGGAASRRSPVARWRHTSGYLRAGLAGGALAPGRQACGAADQVARFRLH